VGKEFWLLAVPFNGEMRVGPLVLTAQRVGSPARAVR